MCYWTIVDFATFNCQDARKCIWAYHKFRFIRQRNKNLIAISNYKCTVCCQYSYRISSMLLNINYLVSECLNHYEEIATHSNVPPNHYVCVLSNCHGKTLSINLNNIHFMKFQYTIIQIYKYFQCSIGFRNKLPNLCKSVSLRTIKTQTYKQCILFSFWKVFWVYLYFTYKIY